MAGTTPGSRPSPSITGRAVPASAANRATRSANGVSGASGSGSGPTAAVTEMRARVRSGGVQVDPAPEQLTGVKGVRADSGASVQPYPELPAHYAIIALCSEGTCGALCDARPTGLRDGSAEQGVVGDLEHVVQASEAEYAPNTLRRRAQHQPAAAADHRPMRP